MESIRYEMRHFENILQSHLGHIVCVGVQSSIEKDNEKRK